MPIQNFLKYQYKIDISLLLIDSILTGLLGTFGIPNHSKPICTSVESGFNENVSFDPDTASETSSIFNLSSNLLEKLK